jgi:CDP-paratose 2-epimerase
MYDRILVTGGAGFVGSSIALDLKRRFPHARITALDNLRRRGSELNLPRLAEAGVRFAAGDIRSPEDLAGEEPELIVECSAEPSAQAGYGSSPEYLIRTNLVGCFHCLELARRTKADFLFLSTSRVYPVAPLNALGFCEDESRFVLLDDQPVRGASARGISEEFPIEGVRSLYGMTKLASELMIVEYADAYGLRCAVSRCGLIAGPWQMGKSDQGVITLWAAAHHYGRDLAYIGFGGAGKQVRDLLHIDDLCDWVGCQTADMAAFNGKVFNVGCGTEVSLSLRELTRICERVSGRRIAMGSISETRPADVRIYITDHTRATEFAGWRPRRDAQRIVADIHAWIAANEEKLRPVLMPGI